MKFSIRHFVYTAMLIVSCTVFAGPVGQGTARRAAAGWLKHNHTPMGRRIGRIGAAERAFKDATGRAMYYAVSLEPEGFVIISADDEVEPVIAFSATGFYDGADGNPLKALLSEDLCGRINFLRQKGRDIPATNPGRWHRLLQAESGDILTDGADSIGDVRVEPLLQSQWGQGDAAGGHCYNYYTNFGTGTYYPAGCVATAMAQLMRYHSLPSAGIGSLGFWITVGGSSMFRYTRGGNGSGGPYVWTDMPLVPASGLTIAQRVAIGALCYDAGVSVNMDYAVGGSGAYLYKSDIALVSTFNYSNSIYSYGFSSSGDAQLWAMMNSNLDAQLPVILGISRTGGGHAVVADGYGYNNSLMYHHLNMGWDGSDNVWYQLPTINTSYYTYTAVDACVYNIYTSGTGEIVSGRVTDMASAAIAGVEVSARIGSSVIKQAVTDSRGIYAMKNLSSNTQYRLSAVRDGYAFTDQYVTTGHSADNSSTTGDRWGIDFTATNPTPPVALDGQYDVSSTQPITIPLQVLDDHLPGPNLLRCVVTSLPGHGRLAEPNVGSIDVVPYTLAAGADGVIYTPCPYFGGQDGFTFRANDGGSPPTGGDSNIATITLNVDNETTTGYHPDSNNYITGGMLGTTRYSVRTQVIYPPADMGSAKRITGLAVHIQTVPGRTLSNWTIRMQHTGLNYFTNPVTQVITTGWTIVYQSNETIGSTGWYWFSLQQPFDYDGTQNLLIDLSFQNSGTAADGAYYVYNCGQNRAYIMYDTDGDAGSPLNWDYYSPWDIYTFTASVPVLKLISTASIDPLVGDFDASCDVKLPDVAIFSQAWMTAYPEADYNPACDIGSPKNNQIDLGDLVALVSNWMETYP